MEKTSVFSRTGIVLVLGLLLMLIGVLIPNEFTVERLCREVGVVVTFMGMIAMVAEHQSTNDARRRPLAHTQPTLGVREGSVGATTHQATAA